MTSDKLPHSVSILVTAFNEDEVVDRVVRETWAIAEQLLDPYEIILIDDGSTDDTGAIVERLARELTHTRAVHHRRNLGFGASYMRGVAEARYDYLMLVCGDDGLPTPNLPRIIEKIGSADIVIPYMRNLKEIKTPFRYFISRVYTNFLNLAFGYRLQYYNGLAVHRRDLVTQVAPKSSGFGFQAELLLKLLKSGCSHVEIGVDGASKAQQSSVLLRPRNILNVLGTCVMLLRELRAFKPIERTPGVSQVNRSGVRS
jgi:dolichol-phosphate mannosyltransferase